MLTKTFISRFSVVLFISLFLSSCGQSLLTTTEGGGTQSGDTTEGADSANPSTDFDAGSQGDTSGITIELYSPCPGPDCVEREAYVPPQEDWCKSGFRLCAKQK